MASRSAVDRPAEASTLAHVGEMTGCSARLVVQARPRGPMEIPQRDEPGSSPLLGRLVLEKPTSLRKSNRWQAWRAVEEPE